MTVRAKFRVRSKELFESPLGSGNVKMLPVTSGSEENKSFYQYTPSGEINLMTLNPAALEQFEVGKEYYIDFTKAE